MKHWLGPILFGAMVAACYGLLAIEWQVQPTFEGAGLSTWLEQLNSPDPANRILACRGVEVTGEGRTGWVVWTDTTEEILPRLWRMALTDPAPAVRMQARTSFDRLLSGLKGVDHAAYHRVLGALLERFQRGARAERRDAIRTIAWNSDAGPELPESFRGPLLAALTDPDEDVRANASWALGSFKTWPADAVPVLLGVLQREDSPFLLRRIFRRVPELIPPLVEAIGDDDPTVARNATELAETLIEQTEPTLRAAARSGKIPLKDRACEILREQARLP